MDKVKLALTILSIAILVVPLMVMVYLNRDNLIGIVLPTQNNSQMDFERITEKFQEIEPNLVRQPEFFPQNKSYILAFNFTNPLLENITVEAVSAQVFLQDRNMLLSNITLDHPLNILPGQSAIVAVSGALTDEAITYLKNSYSELNTVEATLQNIDIQISGVHVHLDKLPSEAPITLPIGGLA
ncbi:MAG: hypothetical protein NWE98_02685 [Candidatus Bathyarchaeota archaeon]|nr:hypothetical protein [Candidatus Bathyarchaeota archaeon]